MKTRLTIGLIFLMSLTIFINCSTEHVKEIPSPNEVLHFYVKTEPVGAEVFWRIQSKTPEVRSSNRFYLGHTPYRRTTTLRIPGLTKENARDVIFVLDIEKPGYLPKSERFNGESILHEHEISLSYHLTPIDKAKPKIIPKSKVSSTHRQSNNRVAIQHKPAQKKVKQISVQPAKRTPVKNRMAKKPDPAMKNKIMQKYNRLKRLSKTSAPANVSASDGRHTDYVYISWRKVKGASRYDVDELELADNKLTHLPPEIGKLKNLIYLGLKENPLSQKEKEKIEKLLPNCSIEFDQTVYITHTDAFAENDKAYVLDLSFVRLVVIPFLIEEIRKLETLYLFRNRIDEIFFDITRLSNLRKLYLSHNELTHLPDEIKELKKLEYLDLRANPISEQEKAKIKKLLPNCKIVFD